MPDPTDNTNLDHILIFTDGSCLGNPGPGGYGALLAFGSYEREFSGGYQLTTNNRMELRAIIAALTALKRRCQVTVFSDSRYVVDSVMKGWVYNWQARGWNGSTGGTPNADLWRELLPLLEKHEVSFEWVRGHNGIPGNERAHALATAAAQAAAERRDGAQVDEGYMAAGVLSG